ncbi:MAG: alpha/beta hydrolase [Verrucomicrobia bacterium]|nr:alpha/beta hydrolase [Verrucomicrobiota bacterium]MDA1066461.1 alpha/beta hydrolase [Verrucomicrobiota bacterium]
MKTIALVFLLFPFLVFAQQNRGPQLPAGTKVTKDIIYQKVGDRELPLDLYIPPGATKPLPLIIWIHGGGWRGGSKNGINQCADALKHGYAVASVEYRLSGEAIFPAAIEDCKAAISYLRWKAPKLGLDPDSFGVWGSSAGGHLVALLGTTNDVLIFDTHSVTKMASPTVQAVCNWFGPTDFLRMNDVTGGIDHDAADSPESLFIGGSIQDHPEKTQRANPITYVSPSDPPMLLMHGDKDESVIYNQSELLYRALQKVGVESQLYKVKNGGHGFRNADESPEMLSARAIAFFDKHLK